MDRVERQRNQDATVFVAGLEPKVTEMVLRELFVQCGPLEFVHFPKDRVTGEHSDFAFVEFKWVRDAQYAMKVLNRVPLYGRALSIREVRVRLLHGMPVIDIKGTSVDGCRRVNKVVG